jgi:hypothetical protein
MAARPRFTEKRCSKLFLSKVHHSLVEMATHELPAELLVKEVIPFLRMKALDIFQFYLVHELFCVAVLRNRRVYPIAIECIKPPILIAQIPKAVYVHGHFSWTGIATRTSASRPLAPTAELGEV